MTCKAKCLINNQSQQEHKSEQKRKKGEREGFLEKKNIYDAKNTSDVVLQNYVFHDSKKSCRKEPKDTSDSMFSMFSHGITAFHGLKSSLRQINQRNPVRVISLTFLFFSKTIRHAWSRCYRRYVYITKRHKTQRNDDF